MLKKILIGQFIFCLFISCSNPTTRQNLLNKAADFNIKINLADSIDKDTEVYAPITINNSKYKLVKGFIACNISDTTSIDTTSFVLIKGCTQLIISYDTAKVWFNTGAKSGKSSLDEITLLAKGQDNKYYYQKCSVDYFVK